MDLNFVQMQFVNYLNSINQRIKGNVFASILIALLGSVCLFYLCKKLRRFKRICDVMSKIPGPPTHFLLGNAILVLYLDRFNFKYGTYVCKCNDVN